MMMCSPALRDPELCSSPLPIPQHSAPCLAPQERPIYASWIASLNCWLIFTNWLSLTGMRWLPPSSWHLTCIHIYWVSCSSQCPLTDTYPGPSPTASARASSLLSENRQQETVSDSPSTCLSWLWHSHFSASLPHLISASVPCQRLAFSVSLWPCSVTDSACLCEPCLYGFSLCHHCPFPPKSHPLPLLMALIVHTQGHGINSTIAHLSLPLHCSPGNRPSFPPSSLEIWCRWFSLSPSPECLLCPSLTFPHLTASSCGIT